MDDELVALYREAATAVGRKTPVVLSAGNRADPSFSGTCEVDRSSVLLPVPLAVFS